MSKCVKQKFDTEFEARAKAAWLALTKPHKFTVAPRVYPCYPCRKWHLTSKMDEK